MAADFRLLFLSFSGTTAPRDADALQSVVLSSSFFFFLVSLSLVLSWPFLFVVLFLCLLLLAGPSLRLVFGVGCGVAAFGGGHTVLLQCIGRGLAACLLPVLGLVLCFVACLAFAFACVAVLVLFRSCAFLGP